MVKGSDTYEAHVKRLEEGLATYAKKSFDLSSPVFVDGGDIYKYYSDRWQSSDQKAKLTQRTPLQLERDRILYSSGIRKQTEKYHVLYNGQKRIVRNYTTHTMRMTQVIRSICRGLKLNADFAEAIGLGSKVGALPFIHASKSAISKWVRKKVLEIDKTYSDKEPFSQEDRSQLTLNLDQDSLPSWIKEIKSKSIFEKVQKYIPYAAGKSVDHPYTSGQESYWILSTNPFTVEAFKNSFMPDTMYGIWRHSRGLFPEENSFHHKMQISSATQGFLEINWQHGTYEAIVVQYADDITWVIENLDDANTAALLNQRISVYGELKSYLEHDHIEIPEGLLRPLSNNDSGGLYTYFITDFVGYSDEILQGLKDGADYRVALRTGQRESFIGLSPEAETHLNKMTQFLKDSVFKEPRVNNRKEMLETLSVACAELLYTGKEDVLPQRIEEKAILKQWPTDKKTKAINLLDEDIHRIQLSVDMLAEMGDQEIYDFVGIQSL